MEREADGEANVGVDAASAARVGPRRPEGPADTARNATGSPAGAAAVRAVVPASLAAPTILPIMATADPAI